LLWSDGTSAGCCDGTPCSDSNGNPYCADGDSVCCGDGACDLTVDPPLYCCAGNCMPQTADNCAACGNPCADTQTCCLSATREAYCANLSSDNQNCNACGSACGPREVCCGGACVPESTSNCGSCGTSCPTGTSCCYGGCVPTRRIGGIKLEFCYEPIPPRYGKPLQP
jgi:hypothetical protein